MVFDAFAPRTVQSCPTRRICVVGSINMDHIWTVPHLPHVSESVRADGYVQMPGGKGAMQAVACMRLARHRPRDQPVQSAYRRTSITNDVTRDVNVVVEMKGAVGDDREGAEMVRTLQDEYISTEHIISLRGFRTGLADIRVDGHGCNDVVLLAGANHEWDLDDVPSLKPNVNLVILQLEIKPETVKSAIKEAKKLGAAVLLNAAPADNFPYDLWQSIDHLIVNDTEAEMLYDSENQRTEKAKTTIREAQRDIRIEHYKEICTWLLKKGVKNVVITLHDQGGVAGNDIGVFSYHASTIAGGVVDRTGCGNVFIGAYAVELMRQHAATPGHGWDIHRAVNWASRAAGLSIKTKGSLEGIPWASGFEPATRMPLYTPPYQSQRTSGAPSHAGDGIDQRGIELRRRQTAP